LRSKEPDEGASGAADSAPAPFRPLVVVAAACFTGALAGSGAAAPGLAVLAALGVHVGRRHGLGFLLACAAAAALCAGRAASGSAPEPARGARWQPYAPPGTVPGEDERGVLARRDRSRPATLPSGAVRPGELVRVLPTAPARQAARGPVGQGRPQPLEPRADELVRLAPARARPGPFERMRAHVERRVREHVAPHRRPFVRALLLGRTSELDWETRDLFVRTGCRHLLAVSGLHVVLLAVLVVGPLARLAAWAVLGRASASFEGVARIVGLALYVPVAGSGAPVVRAACALALTWLATPLAGRRSDGRSVLAAAALVELMLDPRAPLDVGVQLSYAAAGALVVLHGTVRARLERALAGGVPAVTDRLGRPRRAGAARRAVARATVRLCANGWAAALVASGATLPFAWWHFGEWSPLEIGVAPLTVTLLSGWLGAAWAELLGWPVPSAWLDVPADLLLGLLRLLDRLPGTPVLLPERPAWALALVAGLAFVALARAQRPAERAALAGFGWLLLPWQPTPARLELVALDVGHGSAVVVRTPGEPPWIFDAGTRDRSGLARHALAPLLRRWDGGAPVVCLSHADRDHHSALDWVAERSAPARWIGARPPGPFSPGKRDVPRTDLASGRVELPSRGPVRFFLSRGLAQDGNEGSRTLSLATPEGWIHLCGDAEGEGLAAVLDRGHLSGPARLLLFPHHGSLGPHVGRLLAETRPEEIWISTPERAAVADELDRRGLRWRSTATDGPLILAAVGPNRPGERAADRSLARSVQASDGDPAHGPRRGAASVPTNLEVTDD